MARFDAALLLEHVKDAEGFESHPYHDTVGVLTIGYGRNLEKGITRAEGEFLLHHDIADAIGDAESLGYFEDLDPVRQLVIVDMVFNLGLARFLKFKKLNAALYQKDYTLAAHEMMDSKWYTQVGRRAKKLHAAMLTGIWQ